MILSIQTTDLKEIAMKLSALPKQNGSRARIVVITHGSEPTIVVKGEFFKCPKKFCQLHASVYNILIFAHFDHVRHIAGKLFYY